MARRIKRFVSIVLSAALVALSAGFDAQTAAAQTFRGRVAPVSAAPQLGLGALNAPSPSAPSGLSAFALPAPSILAAAPLIAPSARSAEGFSVIPAAMAERIMAAAPALRALAEPETGGSAASAAGRELEDVLTGAASARSSGVDAVAGAPSALMSRLSAPMIHVPLDGAPVPAAAPAPFKSISSASSYSAHRLALKAIAALTGAVFTLPQAGPALTARIIASVADKALVLSDFDDTLAAYNEVLPLDKIEAVRKIRAAGKNFAVISDRGDVKRPGQTQLTVFESLESIPVRDREGIYVAANSGGKVYRYDSLGVPQKVHEAAALTEPQNEIIKAAAAATKARLSEVGAVQNIGDAKTPAEALNTYGYAIMLKPGSSQEAVTGVARILQEELAKRGFEIEVQPRFAKSPENPPYANFSIITKAGAAEYIARALKIEAKDALVIGDAMFVPREAKKAGWLTRLGERLSGRPQVKTGNETDRNMAKGLPGVLALGVGSAMDPRTPNGWALAGHGPAVTQKVLESVGSKARRVSIGEERSRGERYALYFVAGVSLAIFALAVAALAFGLIEFVRYSVESLSGGLPSSVPATGMFLGMSGMLGYTNRSILSDPNESYAQALKRAVEIAVAGGAKADDVRFIEATASLPVRDGAQWSYAFSAPAVSGGARLIYVDFSRFFGGLQDSRARTLEGDFPAPSATPSPMSVDLMERAVTLSPETALDLLRGAEPTFGARASVSLRMQAEPSGDKDAWYRFSDEKGNHGAVNARTFEIRPEMAAVPAPVEGSSRKPLIWLIVAAAAAAIYAAF